MAYGSSPARVQIGAALLVYTKATAMPARSLNHRVRPGIEPASSWILVEFVTTEPTMGTPHQCLTVFCIGLLPPELDLFPSVLYFLMRL